MLLATDQTWINETDAKPQVRWEFLTFLPERFSVIMVGGAAALFGVFLGQCEEIKRWCAREADPVKTFCIFPRIAASLSRSCNAEARYTLDHSYTVNAFSYWPKTPRFWLQLPWFTAVRQLSLEAHRSGDRPWPRPVRLQDLMESLPESFYWHPALIGP